MEYSRKEKTNSLPKPYSSYNLYFLVPVLIWMIAGGVVLMNFDKETLFVAVNTHYSTIGDLTMYKITHMGEGIFIPLVLAALMLKKQFRNPWYFFTATLCTSLPSIVSQVIKRWVKAPRPLTYFHNASWIHIMDDWPKLYHNSFPSGHSTGAFSLFCFLSFLLPPKYKPVGLIFFILALAVCYSRLYVAAHFFADVYAGSLIGCTVCVLSFSIMKYLQPRFFTQKELITTY